MSSSRRGQGREAGGAGARGPGSFGISCFTSTYSLPASQLGPGDSEVGIPAECPLTNWEARGSLRRRVTWHLKVGFPEERTSRLAMERASGNEWGWGNVCGEIASSRLKE